MIETIDTAPDPLHLDITPSVLKLIARGLDGAIAVLPLLNARDASTRQRAGRVLQGAVARHFGFREGSGFPDPVSEQTARKIIDDNGYQAEAPEAARTQAAMKWRKWLAEQGGAK